MGDKDFPEKDRRASDRPESQQKENRMALLQILHLLQDTVVDPLEASGLGLPRECED